MDVIKNQSTAEIVGLCFGDGSLTKRHSGDNIGKLRFQLRGNITEDKEHYDAHVKPLMEELLGKISIAKYIGRKPYYGVSTENQEICKYFVSLGVPISIKDQLKIPEWISNNTYLIKGFLRGFFDTDGSVFFQKNYSTKNRYPRLIKINFGSTSKELISDVKKLLDIIGIKSVIKNPLLRKERNWKTLHILRIESNKDVEKWFEIIGSKNPKHITKFQIWKKFNFCPPHTDLEQRRKILNGELNLALSYSSIHAGVAEPGQTC